jgi:hypothetical protein
MEEAPKSCAVIEYIGKEFGLPLEAACASLYDITDDGKVDLGPEKGVQNWANKFDLVVFSGVIYHVSDPLLSLRLLFNTLK